MVSLPFSAILTFDFKMGVHGLWLGFSLGYFPIIILYMIVIFELDWKEIIKHVRE